MKTFNQRQHEKDTLLKQAKEMELNDSNFLACTLLLPHHLTQDIQAAKEAFRALNIDAIGGIEYQLSKANGWHIHFVTNKEKESYLYKQPFTIDIQKGYDLNGWIWYLTKCLTTHYLTTKTNKNKNENEKEQLAEPTKFAGEIRKRKRKRNQLAEPTKFAGDDKKGIFEMAFIYILKLCDEFIIYKKAPT